jgi:hypothetical protein
MRTQTDQSVKPIQLHDLLVCPALSLSKPEVGEQGKEHELGPQFLEPVDPAHPQVVADESNHPGDKRLIGGSRETLCCRRACSQESSQPGDHRLIADWRSCAGCVQSEGLEYVGMPNRMIHARVNRGRNLPWPFVGCSTGIEDHRFQAFPIAGRTHPFGTLADHICVLFREPAAKL